VPVSRALAHFLLNAAHRLDDAVRARLAAASIDELDAIGERLLTAPTLGEALGDPR
jgi:hypothetical protein